MRRLEEIHHALLTNASYRAATAGAEFPPLAPDNYTLPPRAVGVPEDVT